MGIKSRNIKYSPWVKAIAVLLVWLSALSALGSLAFLLKNEEAATHNSYFETSSFQSEYGRWIYNVVELHVKLKNRDAIQASGETEAVISDNLNRFYVISNSLARTVNFVYYIKDSQTNEEFTNISTSNPLDFIEKQSTVAYFNPWRTAYESMKSETYAAWEMLNNTSYEVYTAVKEPLQPGDAFYDGYTAFNKAKPLVNQVLALCILSALLMILGLAYLIGVAGRREKGGEIVNSGIDRLYADVFTFFTILGIVTFTSLMHEVFYYSSDLVVIVAIGFTLSVDLWIALVYLLSMIRQLKQGRLWRNTLIYRICTAIKSFAKICFSGKFFKGWTLLLFIAYGLVNGFFGMIITSTNDSGAALAAGLFLTGINLTALYFFSRSLVSFSQAMKAAQEISRGNLDYEIDPSRLSVAFAGFAADMQNIQTGLKKAVAEAIKGERLKTELITNVSHDLKTPLTSIVNYVDLLQKEDLHNETAKQYVAVLEEKSARLKQLIEDLVEASKASSGNLTVSREKIDLYELVLQGNGEYEEKIKLANLDMRITTVEKGIFILADGKHMWRIMENLLSNVVKYSMPSSRVYIQISKTRRQGILTIKNISAFPLDIAPDQLTERFVRGDASRTTEGSGLGLSIAQSLAAMQGGEFSIEIDGDLFKVIVAMPLWEDA